MSNRLPYAGQVRVTSPQQRSRWGSPHNGIDLVGQTSKILYSTCTGVVESVGWMSNDSSWQTHIIGGNSHRSQGRGFGYFITIREANSNRQHFYGHMAADSATVVVGQTVQMGAQIGLEGSTGMSTGSHLHYEVRPHGMPGSVNTSAAFLGVPNEVATHTSGLATFQGTNKAEGFMPVTQEHRVISMTNREAMTAGVKAGRFTIIDLLTGSQYDIFIGFPPGDRHSDFTPIGERDSNQMLRNAGGTWNWNGRPAALLVEGKLIACGIHSFPHGSIMSGSSYPRGRKIGNGITDKSNTRPANGWTIGGHMCLYFRDSTGGTPGALAAERDAASMTYKGGFSSFDGSISTLHQPLFTIHNTREDATMREVGTLDSRYKPSINMLPNNPKLSVINYTSMLSKMFSGGQPQCTFMDDFDVSSLASDTIIGNLPQVARRMAEYCLGRGLNRAATAAILANIEAECDFRIDLVERGFTIATGAGVGIMQWTNHPRTSSEGRSTDMRKAVPDWTRNLTAQLDYMWGELTNSFYGPRVLDPMRLVPDTESGLADATSIFLHRFLIPCVHGQTNGWNNIPHGNTSNHCHFDLRFNGRGDRYGARGIFRELCTQQGSQFCQCSNNITAGGSQVSGISLGSLLIDNVLSRTCNQCGKPTR